jgi:hypothetical protein
MKIQKMTTKEVTVDYVRGLVETDGSMQIHISGQQVKPLVKISQKTNENVLPLIKLFLEGLPFPGITSFISVGDTSSTRGRASDLIVSGRHNVRKFLDLLETGTDSFVFSGVKQRDFLVMRELVDNDRLSFALILALKKTLHKENKDQPDRQNKGVIPMDEMERRFGLSSGEANKSAESILKKIDRIYLDNQNSLKKGMASRTLQVSDGYITGLVDGDGGYYVTFSFTPATLLPPKRSKRLVVWQGNAILSMEVGSRLTIELFQYAIGSEEAITEVKSKRGELTSLRVLVRKQENVNKLMEIHARHPLIGNYKEQELQTVIHLRILREEGSLRNLEKVQRLLYHIYEVSVISPKGRPRQFTYEEASAKMAEWLS